ncbi:hypothetical protein [Allonocardiopsis opalescens]|uniref:Uncharacterized protein n=1 Tax=Allonocardiopsis opalescens TaxID=1144618 RepID=A0A2T0Q2X6_9ACTN|nr:hypothetical protein [Allonocardiopsis opalescens]PRX98139.1 hypothetical protein CLV72_105492 [Allonocardiopsis opalescens]
MRFDLPRDHGERRPRPADAPLRRLDPPGPADSADPAAAERAGYAGDGTGFALDRPLARLNGRPGRETPWDALGAFLADADANLPFISIDDAPARVRTAVAGGDRPWLVSVRDAPTDIQYVFAALDGGIGHGVERHEGWLTPEQLIRRVTRLEDPAQLNRADRERSRDAYTGRLHSSGRHATRFTGPDAFATAFVRALSHPAVRAVLDRPPHQLGPPRPAMIPIADLLGPDGHRFCAGFTLDPVGGSNSKARVQREQWAVERATGRVPTVPHPSASPITSFAGGDVVIPFGRRNSNEPFQVLTMFPNPKENAP